MTLILAYPITFVSHRAEAVADFSKSNFELLCENKLGGASCISDFRSGKIAPAKILSPLAFKKHRTVYQSTAENLKAIRAAAFMRANHLTFNIPLICYKFPLSEHTQEG